jgi:hypothetical protein
MTRFFIRTAFISSRYGRGSNIKFDLGSQGALPTSVGAAIRATDIDKNIKSPGRNGA